MQPVKVSVAEVRCGRGLAQRLHCRKQPPGGRFMLHHLFEAFAYYNLNFRDHSEEFREPNAALQRVRYNAVLAC